VGRHAAQQATRRKAPGTGSGKHRWVDEPVPEVSSARHRGSRTAPPLGIPGVVGAIAIAGVLGGSIPTSASGAGDTLWGARSEIGAAHPQLRHLDGRSVEISRSSSRSSVPQAATEPQIEQQASRRAKELARLERQAEREAARRDAARWILPVALYHLTGTFGERSSLWSTVHTGLDFATTWGTPIHSIAAGVVINTGWAGSYGYRTIVELADGTQIWYAHQSRIDVEVGIEVRRGQTIGAVGSTGNSTGSHVHVEVRPGGRDPVDPQVAFPKHGVQT